MCLDALGLKVERYFQASIFLSFERDVHGSVSLLAFFNYLMRSNAALQTVLPHIFNLRAAGSAQISPKISSDV